MRVLWLALNLADSWRPCDRFDCRLATRASNRPTNSASNSERSRPANTFRVDAVDFDDAPFPLIADADVGADAAVAAVVDVDVDCRPWQNHSDNLSWSTDACSSQVESY